MTPGTLPMPMPNPAERTDSVRGMGAEGPAEAVAQALSFVITASTTWGSSLSQLLLLPLPVWLSQNVLPASFCTSNPHPCPQPL